MKVYKLGLLALIGLLGLPAGCGGSTGTGNSDGGSDPNNPSDPDPKPVPVPGLTSLAITPADQAVQVDGKTQLQLSYKVTGTFADGHTEDITSKVAFSHAPVLGTFVGSNLQLPADRGGNSTVTAAANTGATIIRATATIDVRVRSQYRDAASTSLPQDVDTKFAGPNNAAFAPNLVYPNDGVLLPPNLGRLELHFIPQAGTSLYQLTIGNDLTEVKVFLNCYRPAGVATGCIYETDSSVWRAISDTNRGGLPVTVTVTGTDAAGSAVGTSAPITLSFAQDNLQGGLYYWTTTTSSIMRYDFASTTQTAPELFANAGSIGATGSTINCIGCHALSRDGRRMVVEAQGATDGRIAILDVATGKLLAGTTFPAPAKSFFASWNPDASLFVGVNDRSNGNDSGPNPNYNLRIISGTTGQIQETIANTGDATRSANHPDWSADGQKIAYARVERTGQRSVSLQWPIHGSINFVTKSGGTWSGPVEIAPKIPLRNRFFPSIAPDSSFLVYNESICDNDPDTGGDISCDGDSDPSAKIFAAKLQAGATLIPLTKATAPGKQDGLNTNLHNTFPKFSPFNFQRTKDKTSRVNWITFSSTRKYGLRNPPGSGTLLWMVAIDPAKVDQGIDPSFPPFALPFQALNTSNHIAQWTEKVVPKIQ